MRIFLVEDEPIYAEFIKKALIQRKYKINAFLNAEDCLLALNANVPDVIIIDYKLPGMNGIELYEAITKKIDQDKVRIIMLSSIEDGNLVLDFIKRGVRDYVVKDDDVIDSLEAVIEGNDDFYFDD